MSQLVEKREKLFAKQDLVKDVFKLAGPDRDFSKKDVLEKLGAVDSSDAIEKLQDLNNELVGLKKDFDDARALDIKSTVEGIDELKKRPANQPHHPIETKGRSFGQMVTGHEAIKNAILTKAFSGENQGISVTLPDMDIKTLMTTSAGFAPESLRSGLLVEAATRPIQVLDLIPVHAINQAVDKYMAETTRTHSAAEKGEGVAYAESEFVWTEKTSTVRKITDSIPVTDEQLEDEGQVSGILDQRLRFGIRQRLDLQVLVGDGSSPNLAGILDDSRTGLQTQAKGTDPVFDAVFKAMTLVRFTGRAVPNAMIFHPNDWQDIRLTRTADGQYIMGNPATPGATTLFGLPVALSDAITEGTGLVGDFANFCYIAERRGIVVDVGYSGTQFVEGKRTIRASLRAAFTVTREAAFCSITGL